MGQAEDFGEHPCGVCRKGVGDNSQLDDFVLSISIVLCCIKRAIKT